MSSTDSQPKFAFITYQGSNLPRDAETRSLIRRRAMRDVAASRKNSGSYKQHPNRRQYPVFLTNTPPSLPTVTADDHSLLLSLAPLTGLRLGLATCGPEIPGTIRLGSTKIFSFIPSRYGHVSALSCATDCVVAKRRSMVRGGGGGFDGLDGLAQYSKALRALQVALNDEAQRYTPETLCATQLLGMFEVRLGSRSTRKTWCCLRTLSLSFVIKKRWTDRGHANSHVSYSALADKPTPGCAISAVPRV